MTNSLRQEILRTLHLARQRLQIGWTRGQYKVSDPKTKHRWCLVGAVVDAPKDKIAASMALNALRTTLSNEGEVDFRLTAWNDRQESVFPVLWIVDVTIARLEAQI